MKISMDHPGTKRPREFGHINLDKKSVALRDSWLTACDVFRVAFLKACEDSPTLQKISDALDELEQDPNVAHHSDKAGKLGAAHAEKVELRWSLLRRLQSLIASDPELHQLQLARDDAHAAHDVNWDLLQLSPPPSE